MMLTSKCTTVMRWGGISLVILTNYLCLFIAIFPLDDEGSMAIG